jgi:hypothetical protein
MMLQGKAESFQAGFWLLLCRQLEGAWLVAYGYHALSKGKAARVRSPGGAVAEVWFDLLHSGELEVSSVWRAGPAQVAGPAVLPGKNFQ